jgi:hypothetical protein
MFTWRGRLGFELAVVLRRKRIAIAEKTDRIVAGIWSTWRTRSLIQLNKNEPIPGGQQTQNKDTQKTIRHQEPTCSSSSKAKDNSGTP